FKHRANVNVMQCVCICICEYLHVCVCVRLCTRAQENICAYREETVEGQHPQSGCVLSWVEFFKMVSCPWLLGFKNGGQKSVPVASLTYSSSPQLPVSSLPPSLSLSLSLSLNLSLSLSFSLSLSLSLS